MIAKSVSAFFVVAIGSSSANATTAYDGSWILIIRTVRGACDPTYNFQVGIQNGVVSHANIVRLKGRVTGKGAVRVSVAVRKARCRFWTVDAQRRGRPLVRSSREWAVLWHMDGTAILALSR